METEHLNVPVQKVQQRQKMQIGKSPILQTVNPETLLQPAQQELSIQMEKYLAG